jgi:hypothetical protein
MHENGQSHRHTQVEKFMQILDFNVQNNTSCRELTGGLKNFITDTFPYSPTSLIGRRPSGVTR